MDTLRHTRFWLTLGLLLVAFVVVASLVRNPPEVVTFSHSDKAYHITAYFCLSFWFGQIYREARTRLAIGLALVMLGVSLEYLQGLTGYRTFEYADMAANAIGVTLGLILTRTPLSRTLLAVERCIFGPGR